MQTPPAGADSAQGIQMTNHHGRRGAPESSLNRAARRRKGRADRLTATKNPGGLDRCLMKRATLAAEADKAWFALRPGRSYRARLASAAEAEMVQRYGGVTPEQVAHCGPGACIIAVVHQVAPGFRLRKWTVATDRPPSSEAWAAWVWRNLVNERRGPGVVYMSRDDERGVA